MHVVGIDPSSKKIAYVELDRAGRVTGYATIQVPNKMKDRTEKCYYFFVALKELLRKDSILFIESPLVGRAGAHSTIVQSEIQGVLRVAAVECGITQVYPVNVQTWKKEVIGNGHASKDDIRDWWFRKHGDLGFGGDQDLIDAACIAKYGLGVLRRGDQLTGGTALSD